MRTPSSLLVALAVAVLPLGACVQQDGLDATDATEVLDDGKQDGGGAKPLGTYTDPFLALDNFEAGTKFPLISLLILRSDSTFARVQVLDCNNRDACTRGEDAGTYSFTKSGAKRFIRFTDRDGALIDRWQYEVNDESRALKLRPAGTETWQNLPYSEVAFCNAVAECSLQGLDTQPGCTGWTCDNNACAATGPQCGGGAPAPSNACEAAGGTCKPLVPGACADGVILDANDYSCGGPVGVLCCL